MAGNTPSKSAKVSLSLNLCTAVWSTRFWIDEAENFTCQAGIMV